MQEYSTVLSQNTFDKELIILIGKYITEEIQFGQTLKNDKTLACQSFYLPQDYLLHICRKFADFLDNDISPNLKPIKKYLRSKSSLFHSLEKTKSGNYNHPFTYSKLINGRQAYISKHYASKIPHQTRSVCGRELCGGKALQFLTPPSLYKDNFSRYFCTLGHLSSVYCVLFDRTGHYIFTGADDHLVKIWGAWDGRLLATLRGHTGEITDLTIDWENALLGASSTNKVIRVWSLKANLAPVAVLNGHSAMICMLQFSPYCLGNKRYLVSCGNDGNVCIWTYDPKTHEFDPNPLKFIERTRPGNQMLCINYSPGGAFLVAGGSDHFTRIYYFGNERPEKIEELEVHTDRVDSIKFANNKVRFVTGSRDGLACIWSLCNKKWNCLILSMANKLLSDKDEENKSSKLRVTMVSWNCDDSFVLTAITNFKIKVWDSYKGILMHEMKAHTDDIFVLEYHPLDPRLVISASHDGYVGLWDITTGTLVKWIFNNIENRGHGAIFDCKYSPHGLLLAATDSHGQLIIMGLGTNKDYEKSPYEQFFHTDFRPLVRDSNNYVVDEQTQIAPHLMPAPFLVDIDGNPYPPHVQRRVPGRHTCLVEQLVPNVLPNEDGEMEILDIPPASAEPVLQSSESTPVVAPTDTVLEDLGYDKRAMNKNLQNRIIYAINPNSIRNELAKKRELAESEIRAYTEDGLHKKVRVTRQHPCPSGSFTSPNIIPTTSSRFNATTGPNAGALTGPAACSSSSTNSSRGYFSDIINKYANIALNKSRIKSGESVKRQSVPTAALTKTPSHSDSGQSAAAYSSSWSNFIASASSSSPSSMWEDITGPSEDNSLPRVKPLPKRNCVSAHQNVKRRRNSSGTMYLENGDLNGLEGMPLNGDDWGDSYSTSAKSDDSDWIQDYRSKKVPSTNTTLREECVEKRGGGDKKSPAGSNNKFKGHRRRSKKHRHKATLGAKRFLGQRVTRAKVKASSKAPCSTSHLTGGVGSSKKRHDSSLKIWAAGAKRLATSYQRKRKVLSDDVKEQHGTGECNGDRWWLRRNKGPQAARKSVIRRNISSSRGNLSEPTTSNNPTAHGYNTRIRNAPEIHLAPSSNHLLSLPEWMTETLPRNSPFIPQIGDEVVYLRQGHERYVSEVRSRGTYHCEGKGLPYLKHPGLKAVEYAKVTGLKFEIRPPRLCCVRLSVVDPQTGMLTGGLFTLRYHDVPHVVDFLVLKQVYDRSLAWPWCDSACETRKIRAFIDDRWWQGTLMGRDALESGPVFGSSPFLRYTVRWDDNGEIERLSPWDMEPVLTRLEAETSSVSYKCRDEGGLLTYEPKTGEWSTKLGHSGDCSRIKKGLESIMTLAVAEPFAAPVDLRAYPAYAQTIPYPIDLNTIKERVGNHYYRRRAALSSDVRAILSNAQTFNEAGSEIVSHAKCVVDLCENLINDDNCQPLLLYKRLVCDKYLAAGDHSQTHSTDFRNGRKLSVGSNGSTSKSSDQRSYDDNDVDKGATTSEKPSTPSKSKDWIVSVQDLLQQMLSLDDSEPFRQPVNLQEYPEYLSVIKHPMDFITVVSNARKNFYASPQEVRKDVRLIFANSRAYNTNKRSRIYGMTLRLSALFEERMRKLINEHESRIDRTRLLRYRNRKTTAPNDLTIIPEPSSSSRTVDKIKIVAIATNHQNGNGPGDGVLPYDDLQRHRGNFRGLRSFAAASSSLHDRDVRDNPPRSSPPLPPPPKDHYRRGRRSGVDVKTGSENKRCLRSLKTNPNYDESGKEMQAYQRGPSITKHNKSAISQNSRSPIFQNPKITDASEESIDTHSDEACNSRTKFMTQLPSRRSKTAIYTTSSTESTSCESNIAPPPKIFVEDRGTSSGSQKKYDLRHKGQVGSSQGATYKQASAFESSDLSSSSNTTEEIPWNYGVPRTTAKTKANLAPCRRSSRRSVKIRQDSDFEYECC